MCFRPSRATVSRSRKPFRRQAPALPSLAMLDLSKPRECQAHDFLLRATNKRDRMWELISLRRQGDVLLCVVRWVYPDNKAKPFSLAEVSLAEASVYWRCYPTVEIACVQMNQRCAEPR